MLYMPRPAIGGVGLAYRAWNSVVFLLLAGIAKPSRCVKNRRTSRFLCMCVQTIIGECRKPNNKVEAKTISDGYEKVYEN